MPSRFAGRPAVLGDIQNNGEKRIFQRTSVPEIEKYLDGNLPHDVRAKLAVENKTLKWNGEICNGRKKILYCQNGGQAADFAYTRDIQDGSFHLPVYAHRMSDSKLLVLRPRLYNYPVGRGRKPLVTFDDMPKYSKPTQDCDECFVLHTVSMLVKEKGTWKLEDYQEYMHEGNYCSKHRHTYSYQDVHLDCRM